MYPPELVSDSDSEDDYPNAGIGTPVILDPTSASQSDKLPLRQQTILDRALQYATNDMLRPRPKFVHETFSWNNLLCPTLESPLDLTVTDRSVFSMPVIPVPAQTRMRAGQGTLFASAVRRVRALAWPEQQSGRRHKTLLTWRTILEENLQSTSLGRQLHYMALDNAGDNKLSETISDAFERKSIATLDKRSRSMLKFLIWHRIQTGTSGLPLVEARCYEFAKHLQKTAAPTAPGSFMSSINFCRYFLNMEGAEESSSSARINGVCFSSAKRKRPLQQKRNLTVDEVKSLEYQAQHTLCSYDKYACLFFLANLYNRSRYMGLCLASKLTVDLDEEDEGFIEFGTLHSKTQVTAEQVTTFLPLVSPATGITGYKWGRDFVNERKRQGIDKLNYVLPCPGNNGTWVNEPLDVSSAGRWLRDLLRQSGHGDLDKIGTHSLKDTTLSWAAKFNSPLETRTLLGYHAGRELTSTLCYSRDAQSGPLRELIKIMRAVADGSFQPDLSRSGRIIPMSRPDEESESSKPGSGLAKLSVTSSSSKAASDPYQEEAAFPEGDLDFGADSQSDSSSSSDSDSSVDPSSINLGLKSSRAMPSNLDDIIPYLHKSSYIVHAKSIEQTKFKCGRSLSVTYTKCEWSAVGQYLRCGQCFR